MNILCKGIDISRWQGDFDLKQAKTEGFNFVIIKGGGGDDGLYTDSKFARNYENAKRLGMPVGCFFFSRALSVEQAVKEADYFRTKILVGKQFELPVYIDIEGDMLKLDKRLLTDIAHAFCQRLEGFNYWVGIYASAAAFKNRMHDNELQRYAHWVAQWSKSLSYNRPALGMWQYGGKVNNIRSNKVAGQVCDQNYMLIDYPSMIKARGKNGFGEPVNEPESTPEDDANEETTVDVPDYINKVMVFSRVEDGEKYLTKNFQVKEFACKDGSDPVFIHTALPDWCQRIRDKFGYPFSPNSAYRTVTHNAKPEVRGAARSFHIYGLAVDIPVPKDGSVTPQMLYNYAEELVGDSCEVGIYSWGIHMAFCKEKKRFRG